MEETSANLGRFLDGIREDRTGDAYAVVPPDLRMVARVCNGATTKHQLRGREGYAPSTFERLVEKGLLLRGADHELWISGSAARVLLGVARALPQLEGGLEGASRPSRWPFQVRESDPFNGEECLLGPPLLHALGQDLEDYGWGRQRLDRFTSFLEDLGLLSGGERTRAFSQVREGLEAAFASIGAAIAPEGSSRGRRQAPPGLVARIREIRLEGSWTSRDLGGRLRIPWHRAPPRIDRAELRLGERVELDARVRTVDAGRGIEPRISLAVEDVRGAGQEWLGDLFPVLVEGTVRLRLNGVSHRGLLAPGWEPGLRIDGGGFELASVDVRSDPTAERSEREPGARLPISFSR